MKNENDFEKFLKELVSKFEETRKSKGLTQKDVAFNCNMEEQNYRRIEKGFTNPTLKSIHKICKVLDLEIKILKK